MENYLARYYDGVRGIIRESRNAKRVYTGINLNDVVICQIIQ